MNKDILKEAGIDYDEGVARFSGMNTLYEKHVRKYLQDNTFAKLDTAMKTGDYEMAFRLAHDWKGLVGNLSLHSLYEASCPFVEMLRNGADVEGAKAMHTDLEEKQNIVLDAIRRAE